MSNAAKEPQRSEVQTAACARAGQHLMMLFSSIIVSNCLSVLCPGSTGNNPLRAEPMLHLVSL